MFSKISVLCVAALAIVAQAKHERHHTHSHKNGTLTHHPFPDYDRQPSASGGYHVEAGMSSGVAPQPGYPLLSTGASSRLLTTGFPTPTQSGDTTLTYVIGTGSSTTTVVTTIHHTSYRTSYKTVRETIQSTIYVSDAPTAGSGPGGLVEGAATNSVCAAPVTVTVTGPEETVTVTATSTPGYSPSPSSAIVGPVISSALALSSAPYGMNNGTQPTGTGVSTGFLTSPSASFTLKPSGIAPTSVVASPSGTASFSSIAPSFSLASPSGTAPSSSITLSSSLALPSGTASSSSTTLSLSLASPSSTAPSSSSSVWPAVMATVVMQAYD